MNSAIFCGRLVKDPGLEAAGNGIEISKFTIAFDRGYKDKKKSVFVNVTAFGKTAVLVHTYFHKGDGIILECDVDVNKYTDKDGKERTTTEFLVTNVTFPPAKKNASAGQAGDVGGPSADLGMVESDANEGLPF